MQNFHNETDAIKEAIASMNENVQTIDIKYKQSLNASIHADDSKSEESEITALVTQTAKTSQAIRKRLRRIAEENNTFAVEHATNTSAIRIRVATHQAVTNDFMQAMQRFEDTQERHRDAVRLAVERQLRLMNPNAPEEDIQVALKHGDVEDAMEKSHMFCELSQNEQHDIRHKLETLTSRNNDIRELEQSIVNLHEMFVDMQLLIERQGDLLNTIEYNVQETKVKAEEGMHQLVEAHDFQRRANRKKWCVALLVIAVVLIIAVPLLIKYIPIWFPSTAETISQIPIIGGGSTSNNTTTTDTEDTDQSAPESSAERLPVYNIRRLRRIYRIHAHDPLQPVRADRLTSSSSHKR